MRGDHNVYFEVFALHHGTQMMLLVPAVACLQLANRDRKLQLIFMQSDTAP
jgi:hypothetical protein